MSTVEAHWVPMALVAMPTCVLRLREQDTCRLHAVSADGAMTQLLSIDEVECGIPAVGIVS